MGGLELLTDERGFLQCRGRGRRGASYGAGAVVGGAMGPDNPSSPPLLPVFSSRGSNGAVVVYGAGVVVRVVTIRGPLV